MNTVFKIGQCEYCGHESLHHPDGECYVCGCKTWRMKNE